MELRTIMENFIKYKHSLDDVERQGLEDTAEDSYEKQFMKLRDLSANLKTDGIVATLEGEKKCNSSKNRYKDILPYDHCRVRLAEVPNVPGSDYINACHIKGVTGGQSYIAAQGPMPETVNDFWRLLWDNKVKVILMACNEYEGIPRKLRCQRYWSTSPSEVLEFGDISVTLTAEQKADYDEFAVRHLKATRGEETRELYHFHYTAWPDRGVPKCVESILHMIDLMRTFQPPYDDYSPPVVVHCSAGCGRTGTILVLDYVGNMIKFAKLTPSFSLFNVVLEMRKQRMAIVQSLDQYSFVHEAVVELFNRQLKIIDEHPYYDFAEQPPRPTISSPASSNRSKPAPMPVPVLYEDVEVPKPKESSGTAPATKTRPDRLPSLPDASDKRGSDPSVKLPAKPTTSPRPSSRTSQASSSSSVGASNSPDTETAGGGGAVYAMPNKAYKPRPALPQTFEKPTVTSEAAYAEVSRGHGSPISPGGPVSRKSAENSEYAYVDPNACDRWALQHVARYAKEAGVGNATSSSEYAEIPYSPTDLASYYGENAYAVVDVSKDSSSQRLRSDSDSDEGIAPTPPPKFPLSGQGPVLTQQSSQQLGIGGRLKNLMGQKTQTQSSPFDPTRTQLQPTIFQGVDISYPNRVGRPKYGARQMKSSRSAQAVRL